MSLRRGPATHDAPKDYGGGSEGNSTALLANRKKMAAKIVATCEFPLKAAPADPNLVNVYLDEVVLPKEPVNGWKIDGTKSFRCPRF